MTEIGLFCGTFNPIHLGHLLIAECARDQFKLDRVIFVTSPMPPHRSQGLLPGWDRHAMVEAAIAGNHNFVASTVELEREGPSYTIDTVKQIREEYKHHNNLRINLIIGGDNVPLLREWHHASELTSLCRLLVAPRLRYNEQATQSNVIKTIAEAQGAEYDESSVATELHADIQVVHFPGIAISASMIRKRVESGQSVLYMVPPAVAKMISDKKYFLQKSELPSAEKR